MDKVLALMEDIGRYLTLLKVTDFVDIAIIIFLVYKLLSLVKSTRAENILKGVAIFLLALGLSTALDLRAVIYSKPRGGLGHSGVDHSVPAGDPPDTGAAG